MMQFAYWITKARIHTHMHSEYTHMHSEYAHTIILNTVIPRLTSDTANEFFG